MNEQPAEINPWADADARYQPGQEVRGSVTRVAQFGVFVQVEPGIEGVLYAFELETPTLASFTRGQEMLLYVKNIDVGKKRLELSLHNSSLPGPVEENEVPRAVRREKRLENLSRPALPLLPDQPGVQNEQGCPTCQRAIRASWKYCVYCGGALDHRCPSCGSAQPDLPGARYCCACGQPL